MSQESERSSSGPTEDVHFLRRTAANRKIVETNTPRCVFTLHIGTLVLSDEAVLHFQDKALLLAWKFYAQAEAMTRLRPGRVVLLHCLTECSDICDEHFVDYMKRADMPITIRESGSNERPLAYCSLPLREALLRPNQRTDMSLAVVPFPDTGGITRSAGGELGVLDLWCKLSVDATLLPTIQRAIHTLADTDRSQKYIRPSDEVQTSFEADPSSRYDDEVRYEPTTQYRRRSTQTQKSIPTSDLGHRSQEGLGKKWPTIRQESSGIIVNEVPANIKTNEDMKRALERNAQRNTSIKPAKMDDNTSQARSSIGSEKSLSARQQFSKLRWPKKILSREYMDSLQVLMKKDLAPSIAGGQSTDGYMKDVSDPYVIKQYNNFGKGLNKIVDASKKTVKYTDLPTQGPQKSIDITILWVALNEECEAMVNPNVQRLYVAYSFLGRRGADLETPVSLPKPSHYADKCHFNFKKTFHLQDCDLPLVGHMARSRSRSDSGDPRDCLVFTLVSEPPEDPLGLTSCEDIGYAYLYLGDVLAYSGDSGGYTEVVGVRGVRGGVCGVLAVRIDNLQVLRHCLALTRSHGE